MTTALRSIQLLMCGRGARRRDAGLRAGDEERADGQSRREASACRGAAAGQEGRPARAAAELRVRAAGRRDPFISLVNRGKDQSAQNGAATAKRAEGVPGMLTGELTVRGIMQTRGAWVAMVSGPDGKVYTVRAGDKLADGVIRQVTATSVVILQEVNDPLSLEKQREVRKFLRGGDEVK